MRNAWGNPVTNIDNVVNKAGTFEVTVSVKAKDTGFEYGGTRTFTVTTYNDSIDADAQVFVSYNKEVITSLEKWYVYGSPINVTDFNVTVKKSDGTTADRYKYAVSLIDSEGKKVTSTTDAGEYTLKITSDKFEFTGTTEVPITIHKADLTTVKLNNLETLKTSEYLPLECAESTILGTLDPQCNTHVQRTDGSYNWIPADWVDGWNKSDISIEKWDAEKGEWFEDTKASGSYCDEAGKYRLVIKGNEKLAKNYEYANADYTTTCEFTVVSLATVLNTFDDVLPTDWFFNCVNVMHTNGSFPDGNKLTSPLIKGYADTNVFGPNDTITRADVAVILYRMAQGHDSSYADPDLGYTENVGWVTGFSDIDEAGLGNMYFAKAVGWANKMGVVNGYDDGTFGPYDEITREQLATMLANFAKVVYRDEVSLVEGELDAMPDGGSVSVWAEKAVSWCLENELMGNDGSIRPTDTITRAETAAMAYNYLTKVVGLK